MENKDIMLLCDIMLCETAIKMANLTIFSSLSDGGFIM